MTQSTTLAVIPARGGSKGLPRKNIRVLAGKPLIAWSIEAAKASGGIDRVVVSTDDAEIGSVAAANGAEVLWRPPELATDDATTISVIRHIAREQATDAGTLVILQPTSPLRDAGLIDGCLKVYRDGGHDNLATGFWCKYQAFGSHNNMRRQDYQGFFYDDGNVYVLDRSLALAGRWFGDKIARHVIAKHQNFEIDDEVDFAVLESLMARYGAAARG